MERSRRKKIKTSNPKIQRKLRDWKNRNKKVISGIFITKLKSVLYWF